MKQHLLNVLVPRNSTVKLSIGYYSYQWFRAVDPRIDEADPLSMVDGARSMDMRRELDGLKEQVKDQLKANSDQTKKSIEDDDSIEFPKFNGEDLRGRIYRCEQFFEVDDTLPQSKVRIAVVHLEGKALHWHKIFMKKRLPRDLAHWGEFVKAVNDRFGTLLYEDPMSELVNLKQTSTIQAY
ncbi:hypothetical protein BUALT_Bualt04G0169000 [Buddleja alternifolia]|uniref:Retrotransposon gag domain-containing protein n=1 Tax=Buddleja alternifolia TaxID=168488 RepID=A0AAV6XW56_9LAMI|nr:hypothetical protein BUALT_Bualt04G0169000 [Buddleja alternifolia]